MLILFLYSLLIRSAIGTGCSTQLEIAAFEWFYQNTNSKTIAHQNLNTFLNATCSILYKNNNLLIKTVKDEDNYAFGAPTLRIESQGWLESYLAIYRFNFYWVLVGIA